MESHGGYLCPYEDVDVAWLQRLARQAIETDGQLADDCGLLVSVLPGAKVVRFAFDGAHTYGRNGARWYLKHHAFAKRLSEFVSNAGNTLYKGISEILDRTMRERREHGDDVDAMKGVTAKQIQQVKAGISALKQLREGLWSTDDEPALPELTS